MSADPIDFGFIAALLTSEEMRLLLLMPPMDYRTLPNHEVNLAESLRYKRLAPDLYAGLVEPTAESQGSYRLTPLGRWVVTDWHQRLVSDLAMSRSAVTEKSE
jgi:hypothetical protein